MKILTLLFISFSLLMSKVYYSKVEPYEVRDISSNVSGLVLFADEDKIGQKLSSDAYIKIDKELDTKELESIDKKIVYLNSTIIANESILKNLKMSLGKKRENYKAIESLKIKSKIEKDREFHDLINSENAYLNTEKEITNLKVQLSDLELRRAQLTRNIADKNLIAKGFTLYSLLVKPGQVVGIATPLAQVADTSKAKLTIFLDESDMRDAKSKTVYIDGKQSKYKVSRVLNIADSKNISKYMAQIIIDSPEFFSKLVKVELK